MANCACIKKREFDLYVAEKGCGVLVIEDQSVWVKKPEFEVPEAFNVTIDIPSRGVSKELTLYTNKRNIIHNKDLFGLSVDKRIPDDIYCFSTISCGYELKINRAYLCNAKSQVRDLIYKYVDDFSKERREIISNLNITIQAIEINAKIGNVKIASELLKSLNEKLKNFNCVEC